MVTDFNFFTNELNNTNLIPSLEIEYIYDIDIYNSELYMFFYEY